MSHQVHLEAMEDQHEILTFYGTPRNTVVGISPIPKEDIVPISYEYIDKIRLEDFGELEMTLGETTVREHDPYRPPIPISQSKKRKRRSKLLKTGLGNLQNVCSTRGSLDSPVSSPSVKLLKTPLGNLHNDNNVSTIHGYLDSAKSLEKS